MKRLSVIGLGYIGLPTAVHAAQQGYDVAGFDIDHEKVKKINAGILPFYEKGLKEILHACLQAKTFYASTDLAPADFFLIAVPTPFTEGKKPDLSYVFEAVNKIAFVIEKQSTIILESTVSIGATRQMCDIVEKKTGLRAGIDFYVAHCPERILPGKMFEELVQNDRVIGGINKISSEKAAEFYAPLVKSSLFLTDDKTAEMVKLVENSSRDVAIAFANEIARIAEAEGINPHELIALANKHPRVSILNPGIGVGGHCIAVDPWFLISQHEQESRLMQQARFINDQQPVLILKEVEALVESIKKNDPTRTTPINITILGLTYKSDIDDIRESPALHIAQTIAKMPDLELHICEPNLSDEQVQALGFKQNKGLWQAVSLGEIILILVLHKEFFGLKSSDLQQKKYIDPCGLFFKLSFLEHKNTDAPFTLYQAPHSTPKIV
jgi:UDP-N-acetyl-D-mannosaminuronic acid dehydrogenase